MKASEGAHRDAAIIGDGTTSTDDCSAASQIKRRLECHCLGVFGEAVSSRVFLFHETVSTFTEHCSTEDGRAVAPDLWGETSSCEVFSGGIVIGFWKWRHPEHSFNFLCCLGESGEKAKLNCDQPGLQGVGDRNQFG